MAAYFFALLLCSLSGGYEAKRAHGARNGEKAKMARRQTEATYLEAILVWLQGYWTE